MFFIRSVKNESWTQQKQTQLSTKTNPTLYKNITLAHLEAVNRSGMDEVIDCLNESDFFTAPTSSKYHDSCLGGLSSPTINSSITYNASMIGIITAALVGIAFYKFIK